MMVLKKKKSHCRFFPLPTTQACRRRTIYILSLYPLLYMLLSSNNEDYDHWDVDNDDFEWLDGLLFFVPSFDESETIPGYTWIGFCSFRCGYCGLCWALILSHTIVKKWWKPCNCTKNCRWVYFEKAIKDGTVCIQKETWLFMQKIF